MERKYKNKNFHLGNSYFKATHALKYTLLLLFAYMMQTTLVYGQGSAHKVTGHVFSSEDSQPIPGANVSVKGTKTGTITGVDGAFTLDVSDDAVLVISFIGYEKQEIATKGLNNVDVKLVAAESKIDEVVVVGYGTQRKSDLTGAVVTVSSEDLKNSNATNIDQVLQGRVSGVQLSTNSGQPGGATSIRIRGASSINGSNEPLYVIDGIPFQGDGATTTGFDWAGGANGQNRVNPLSTINPSDIVSMEVLKDASASAIYGSRAANGVVIITTKKGKKGEAKINYSASTSIQKIPKTLKMMDLQQYAQYQNEVRTDLGLQMDQHYADPSLLGAGTDWQSAVFKTATSQNHQLSIIGGTDKTTYAITGGYFTQDGIVIGSGFDRITTRVNLENQVKGWIKVGGNLSYAKTNEKITLNDGGDGVIMQALLMSPDVPVKDMNGNYAGPSVQAGATSYNPVAEALQRNSTLERQRIMSNIFASIDIIKGLNFRSEVSFDYNSSIGKAFNPTYNWGVIVNNENEMLERQETSFFWMWKNYLTYNIKYNLHDFTVMAGTEAQRSQWEGTQILKRDFASNDLQVMDQGDNATSSINGWKDASSIASYFARFNYNYNDRYLLTFTERADGSSKFGSNNKWGYFPSGSVAWKMSNENFMKGLSSTVSNLKLRIGIGQVGNQAIGDHLFDSPLTTVTTPFGTAYYMQQISNPNLKWETTTQSNVGLDASFLNNRIEFSFDVYDKETKNMLLQLTLPGYLGGSNGNDIQAPYANVGQIQNRGLDLSLTTHNIKLPKFSWSTDFTFSLNRNKVVALDDPNKIYWTNLYWYSEFQTVSMVKVGQPLGVFYGYVTEGLFQNQADILNHAVQIVDPSSVSTSNPNGKNLVNKQTGVWIGDVKFKDLNGDGIINSQDQTVIGNPNPKFTYGFNNTFTYGPISLNVYINGVYGGDILNYAKVMTESQTSVYNNQAADVANRAQIGLIDPNGSTTDPSNLKLINPSTNIPRPTTNDNNRNNRMSDRFIESGTYMRIQSLTLAYTFPSVKLKKIKIERLKIFFNGQNLYTFTNYSGYDPEIGSFNQNSRMQNIDMGRYPNPRSYIFGIDVDF